MKKNLKDSTFQTEKVVDEPGKLPYKFEISLEKM